MTLFRVQFECKTDSKQRLFIKVISLLLSFIATNYRTVIATLAA
jgi:hypothetical protein